MKVEFTCTQAIFKMKLRRCTLLFIHHKSVLLILLVLNFQCTLSNYTLHSKGSILDVITGGSLQKILGLISQKADKTDNQTDANAVDKLRVVRMTSATASRNVSVVNSRRQNVETPQTPTANISVAGNPLPFPGFPVPLMPMMPMYPLQPPPVLYYSHTYYEPVVHDHPPLRVIQKLIKEDEKKLHKWRHHGRRESSDDTDSSDYFTDSSSSSDTSSDIDYFRDAMHIRA